MSRRKRTLKKMKKTGTRKGNHQVDRLPELLKFTLRPKSYPPTRGKGERKVQLGREKGICYRFIFGEYAWLEARNKGGGVKVLFMMEEGKS